MIVNKILSVFTEVEYYGRKGKIKKFIRSDPMGSYPGAGTYLFYYSRQSWVFNIRIPVIIFNITLDDSSHDSNRFNGNLRSPPWDQPVRDEQKKKKKNSEFTNGVSIDFLYVACHIIKFLWELDPALFNKNLSPRAVLIVPS